MRNHSPFLLQTNKKNNMSKNLKQNKMDIKTYIPNQQKSSFTIYRKFIVDIVNETIEYKNKSINNKSEKLSLIDYDEIKSILKFKKDIINLLLADKIKIKYNIPYAYFEAYLVQYTPPNRILAEADALGLAAIMRE